MPRHTSQHVAPTLSANIRRYRKAKGLTQVALARIVGMDSITVSRWERGKVSPPLTTQIKIAEALGVEVSDFYLREAA